MYIFKNLLTNPDPNVQDKARYFADCFEFILNNMGKYDFPPMENHRSLMEKIRLQFVNYSPQHSAKYVLHYAKHPFLDKKDEMMKCYYSSYNRLVQKLRSTLFRDPEERKLIVIGIDEFLSDLESSIMKNAMEEIHSVLHCVENLSQHNHPRNLDYATGIVISEFRFNGFKVGDIDRLVERILSNEIKMVKGRPCVEFPLPANLIGQRFANRSAGQFKQVLQSFMDSRTLREQFQGISNLYENAQAKNTVLFRIVNLKTKKRTSKTYGQVKMTTAVKSYLTVRSNEKARSFMLENGLYFEVALHSTNIDAGQLLATELIRKELPRFEVFFGTTIIVDYNFVLMKLDGITHWRQSQETKWLTRVDPAKTRIETKLGLLNSHSASSFKLLEIIYAQAKTAQLPDQKLNHYWRYLEACKGDKKINTEQLLKTLADIFANWGLNDILFSYVRIADEILSANREGIERGKIKMGYLEIMDFMNVNTVQAGWIVRANEILNHPFLKYRSQRTLNLKISEALAELVNYYEAILFEAYEQRNFIQHAGIFHPLAVEKLLLTIPSMVETLRKALLSRVLRGKEEDIGQVVRHLALPPDWMTKMIKRDLRMCDI